jgi:hypothetical protein
LSVSGHSAGSDINDNQDRRFIFVVVMDLLANTGGAHCIGDKGVF